MNQVFKYIRSNYNATMATYILMSKFALIKLSFTRHKIYFNLEYYNL